jgi:hypothetical protein
MTSTVRIKFTDFWKEAQDLSRNPIYRRLDKAFDLELVDDPDFIVYSCFGHEYLKYDCIRIFYSGENVRPNFEECDYAFSSDYPVTERNFRMPLYGIFLNEQRIAHLSDRTRGDDSHPPIPDKFCNFLYSNPSARERIRFFKLLSRYRRVDSGGKVLNNLGYRVDDKMEFLKQYKFTIAFENSSWPGYTTEKLIQPLLAGSIPIYWGNPLVYRDFNPEAFVNCHDYDSFDEVVEQIRRIDTDDDLYRKYREAPAFPADGPRAGALESNVIDRFRQIFSEARPMRPPRRLDMARYGTMMVFKLLNWAYGQAKYRIDWP